MNRILQFTIFLFIFSTSLSAGFLPSQIYKSIENKVKESIDMQKPDYDKFIRQEEQKIQDPQDREEYIKNQFLEKDDIVDDVINKEEISIEREATQFFDSLNQEHKKPVDME